jgi:hypothetical protein
MTLAPNPARNLEALLPADFPAESKGTELGLEAAKEAMVKLLEISLSDLTSIMGRSIKSDLYGGGKASRVMGRGELAGILFDYRVYEDLQTAYEDIPDLTATSKSPFATINGFEYRWEKTVEKDIESYQLVKEQEIDFDAN